MAASDKMSLATYPKPRAAERSKQWAGIASRICLMVKSGIWNSLPYVSSIFALPLSSTVSESMEERDVEEGEWRGVSPGEATTELSSDEGLESVVAIRCSTLLAGKAVVVIVVEIDAS